MKKIITLLLLFVALSVQAAGGHLKFLGIPLNGPISSFQTKLVAKGYKLDKFYSKNTPKGARVFDGVFTGKKAKVVVYYDTKTNNVYGAKAFFDDLSQDEALKEYNRITTLFEKKYSSYEIKINPSMDYKNEYISTENGIITVYINKIERIVEDLSTYTVNVEYDDKVNMDKNFKSELDDL